MPEWLKAIIDDLEATGIPLDAISYAERRQYAFARRWPPHRMAEALADHAAGRGGRWTEYLADEAVIKSAFPKDA